jgi:hypothetical protein
MGIGDWGMGVWPNPQSPIPKFQLKFSIKKLNPYKIKKNNIHHMLEVIHSISRFCGNYALYCCNYYDYYFKKAKL